MHGVLYVRFIQRFIRAVLPTNKMTMASACQEDNPRQSSAALCISFDLLGESFGPEFTHQCFPCEWIRGYQPKNLEPAKTQQQQQQHSSHTNHENATHELQIQVKLSPSCRQSQVNVQIQRKPREIVVTRASKRPRLMSKEDKPAADANLPSDDDDEEEEASPDEETTPEEKEEDSDYVLTDEEDESEEANHDANAGMTRARRMPLDEIIERCGKALPTMVQDLKEDDFLKEPIGTILHEYQRNNNLQFVISLADGSNAVQYHSTVQTLATWFIETADNVDVASQDGGYWKVLYLFRRNALHQYSLAGYLTLFHFLSPFKKPKSGIVARVCQALILPPYQRMGHGKMLLKCVVHELATIPGNNSIVEVNVEDPAPAFVALRNCVDYELFQESLSSTKNPWLDSIYTINDIHHPDFFRGVSDKDAIAAGAVARITPRQVQICHEIYKLSLIGNEEEEVSKQYRIMVKKRLAKVHREELGAYRTKEEKQARLGKIFDETLEQYKSVLKRK